MNYVLSLDLGTSSVRASLYDDQARAVPELSVAIQHAPDTTPEGGVEMDADGLLERTLSCVEQVLHRAGDRARQIRGVGVCTFWHSILGVSDSAHAITPILMWADTRSVAEVAELRTRLDERELHRRTGCLLHTSYPGPRLLWVAHHRREWLGRARWWMSPGEYLLLRLLGHRACGVSMASGTGMYHQAANAWDEEFLRLLPVNADQLSPSVDSTTPFAGIAPEFAGRFPALANVPWFPAAGDGACSNVGSGCTEPNRVALMVGTSGAVRVMREGSGFGVQGSGPSTRRSAPEPLNVRTPGRLNPEPDPPRGLWKYRWDRRRYLLGGALSNGGNLFAWLRETLRVPEIAEVERKLAEMEPDAHGLTVLPFLAGERCPGWRGDARAAVVGLSWNTEPAEIMRAGLEAVAYRFALIHELLREAAAPDHQIVASGGALLASPVWTQMVADALGREVIASEEEEATSRGAALLALEGTGLLRDIGEVEVRLGSVFRPDPERHARYVAGRRRQSRLYEALIERDWRG